MTNSFIEYRRLTYTTINIKTDAEEYSRSGVFCLFFCWGKSVIALKSEEVDLGRPLLTVLNLAFWYKILC